MLYLVGFVGSLCLEIRVWNGQVTLVEAELRLFILAGLQDLCVCAATGNDCDWRKAIALDLCI